MTTDLLHSNQGGRRPQCRRGCPAAVVQNRLGDFEPNAAASLSSASAAQQAEQAEFNDDASLDEQQHFADTVAGQPVDDAQGMELQAIASSQGGGNLFVATPPAPPHFANASRSGPCVVRASGARGR